MSAPRSFTVSVPATSANLGPGFDVLGLALPLYNRLTVTESPALTIVHTGPEAAGLPTDASHLAYKAARLLATELGKPAPMWHMALEVNIPQSRGLGSSSACIVGGLLGANTLMGSPLTREDLVNLAAVLEATRIIPPPPCSGGSRSRCWMKAGSTASRCPFPAASSSRPLSPILNSKPKPPARRSRARSRTGTRPSIFRAAR